MVAAKLRNYCIDMEEDQKDMERLEEDVEEFHIEEDIQRVMRTAKTKNAYGLQMAAMNIKHKSDWKTRAKRVSAHALHHSIRHLSTLIFFSQQPHFLIGSWI